MSDNKMPTHVFAVACELTKEEINLVTRVLAKLGGFTQFSTDFKTFDRFYEHALNLKRTEKRP